MFASELRYQTPPVLGKIANIATKKDDQKGQVFIQWLQPTDITRIPLESILSNSSTS
jgi:hypothetical protein